MLNDIIGHFANLCVAEHAGQTEHNRQVIAFACWWEILCCHGD
jgi:hypothetical protein